MKRKVNVNFPNDFQFPEEYDYDVCAETCRFCHVDTEELNDYCSISGRNNKCPFYGKGEDYVLEI